MQAAGQYFACRKGFTRTLQLSGTHFEHHKLCLSARDDGTVRANGTAPWTLCHRQGIQTQSIMWSIAVLLAESIGGMYDALP
jgi:hypothetical protein